VVAKQASEFIARTERRACNRVHVELYGAQKKVQIPFVMGRDVGIFPAMRRPLPPVDEPTFPAIDVDNFRRAHEVDEARVAFSVPNT